MSLIQLNWPLLVPSCGDLLLSTLAHSLTASEDPVAADPAQLMIAAGLTPDDWQRELLQSDWQKALLLCSRQSGKSTVCAAIATHTACYVPGSLILLLSAALRQSQELFRKTRAFYSALPDRVAIRQQSALQMEFTNGSRIVALPGREQTVRGFSNVGLLIVDEASRVADELYYSIRPMLAVSGGRLICLSTPFGKRGFFFEEWTEGSEDWRRVKIVADDVPRITSEFLEEERRSLGQHWYAQEYQCEFRETLDQVFSYDLIMDAMSSDIKPLVF